LSRATASRLLIVCSREQKNVATLTKEDIRRKLISDRVELASRQLQRELRRKADIQRFRSGDLS